MVKGSYLDIAEVIQQYGARESIASDLAQLYRRVVFSILLANHNDHLRNHGFLRMSGGWRLSPAFDINPNPDKHDHALAIDEADPTPSVSSLHATCRYYRLTDQAASRIEGEVRAAVREWQRVASATAISSSEQRLLADIIQPDAE
jgi:serine/threonine-protein kinase HipA